jgi:hypothetical protein
MDTSGNGNTQDEDEHEYGNTALRTFRCIKWPSTMAEIAWMDAENGMRSGAVQVGMRLIRQERQAFCLLCKCYKVCIHD